MAISTGKTRRKSGDGDRDCSADTHVLAEGHSSYRDCSAYTRVLAEGHCSYRDCSADTSVLAEGHRSHKAVVEGDEALLKVEGPLVPVHQFRHKLEGHHEVDRSSIPAM